MMRKDSKKKWRQDHPVHAAWSIMRCNARRRGIEFSLTLQEFTGFCVKTRLLTNSGRNAESYTVDRIDITKGYTIDNIQMLTKSENSAKRHREYYWDEHDRCLKINTKTIEEITNSPF